MSYSEYAPHYDNLCNINPAYQEMRHLLKEYLLQAQLGETPTLCDLGAGTGNFVCTALEIIPKAKITHLDCCPDMNSFAKQKYGSLNLDVSIVEAYMQNWDFDSASLDLVICVNSLNNAPPVFPMLRKINAWLKPGGSLFLIDFGRQIKIIDWTWYLLKHSLQTSGLSKTVRSIVDTRKAFISNRAGQSDQEAGRLWTHTTDELEKTVTRAGFSPTQIETCYRDYADLVIATKPTSNEVASYNEDQYMAATP